MSETVTIYRVVMGWGDKAPHLVSGPAIRTPHQYRLPKGATRSDGLWEYHNVLSRFGGKVYESADEAWDSYIERAEDKVVMARDDLEIAEENLALAIEASRRKVEA